MARPQTDEERARGQIEAFERKFGVLGKLYRVFAAHAAMPLILTPDLLYRMRAYPRFQRDVDGAALALGSGNEPLVLPWHAPADLLISDLCRQISPDLYEMDGTVRKVLLAELRQNSRLDHARLREIAGFVRHYVRLNREHLDRAVATIQDWLAWTYAQPGEALIDLAHQLAEISTKPSHARLTAADLSKMVRLSNLAEHAEPAIDLLENNRDFRPLLLYIRSMGPYARNDLAGADAILAGLPARALSVKVGEGSPLEFVVPDELLPWLPSISALDNISDTRVAGSLYSSDWPDLTDDRTTETDIYTRLREALQDINERPACRAIYIQGRSGLGKSYILEHVPEYFAQEDISVRLCHIIDMTNPETRKPLAFETLLRRGLSSSELPIPAEQVDAVFTDYDDQRAHFERSFQHARDERLRQRALSDLRVTFAECWNSLSAEHPLVIRLDTLELLIGMGDVPDEALIRRPEARAGVLQVISWLVQLLPQLERTLVLLSGRPPRGYTVDQSPPDAEALDRADAYPNLLDNNDLAVQLRDVGVLTDADFLPLLPLDDASITTYLAASGLPNPPHDSSIIRIMTGGAPLLLALYVESQRPDPPSLPLVTLDNVTTRSQFETCVVDTILDPLRYTLSARRIAELQIPPADQARIRQKRTLIYALYVLSYARRGIRSDDLRKVVGIIEPELPLTIALLDELRRSPLVKTIQLLRIDGTSDVLFYLHDEIWLLIDESGRPDQLGLRKPVLDQLQRQTAEAVRRIPQAARQQQLLRAMADHVYYAVTREFHRGYRFYLVYLDHLLGLRNHEDAVALADMFWRMLTLTVVRTGGLTRIYRDWLAEDPYLNDATVRIYDQLHYSQLLYALGLPRRAADEARFLLEDLISQGVLPEPSTVDTRDSTTWPTQIALFASLLLTRANALTRMAESAGTMDIKDT